MNNHIIVYNYKRMKELGVTHLVACDNIFCSYIDILILMVILFF